MVNDVQTTGIDGAAGAETRRFKKVLAANRGEVAIRVFRACTELGISTVGIYSHEDLLSIHRYKADEAYLVGKKGDPVGAYLDQQAIIDIALSRGVDAIHPGYGFLSENAEFARRCAAAGITFIGPSPEVLDALGDKVKARNLAIDVGIPVVPGTDGPAESAEEIREFARGCGYPIMLKASFGGGGRGMRIVRDEAEVEEAFERVTRESLAAFGRAEIFAEKLIERPKHIEIQILGDQHGNMVHLYERDCSIQRRHQKLVEMAPAISLNEDLRQRLYSAALRLCAAVNYSNAGTAEFLVTPDGNFYFIEVNPRLQVEHTVTERVTGRDLVQAQIHIAEGHSLSDTEIGISSQQQIDCKGTAIQCRITTEDPSRGFAPDTGTIEVYRSAAGFGVRLDTGVGGAGSVISSDYDTLIVKVTAWALTFEDAASKVLRSLREFRIRGVNTNIAFLENAVSHPNFLSGNADVTFIDSTPELMAFRPRRDRATKLLRTIGFAVVNGPMGATRGTSGAEMLEGLFDPPVPVPKGGASVGLAQSKDDGPAMAVFRAEGAVGFAKWLRAQERVQLTDTTLRDAHQSLLATRVRTIDMMAVAPAMQAGLRDLASIEMWGGATFDCAYRFLREDPWLRLEALREAIPGVPFQMLLRGANAVGYANYPDNVVRRFIQEAAARGIDVFRIFDALNYIPNMELAMDEVARSGKIVEATICYTGDILDPARDKYTLRYYLDLAQQLEKRGAHVIALKDMAGLLRPDAAETLIIALREHVGLPIHLHTHDTSGNGVAMLLRAVAAGVDAVDVAVASMSGLTSQPSMNALLYALRDDPCAPSVDFEVTQQLSDYWEVVREHYAPFESGMRASTAEVYKHEIPGGQYSNLRPRAIQLGLGHRWTELKERYRDVNLALGDIIKVTPTSKVVADFAMFLLRNDLSVDEAMEQADKLDFPQSLVDFFSGRLGQPYGGFPKALQRAVLGVAGATSDSDASQTTAADASMAAAAEHNSGHDFDARARALQEILGRAPTIPELLSDALYPAMFSEYLEYVEHYGDPSALPTRTYLFGLRFGEQVCVDIDPGKRLVVKLGAVGKVDAGGNRRVYFELNGQPRHILIPDLAAQETVQRRPQADPHEDSQVGASMPGKVVQLLKQVGDQVVGGETILVTEAMKMETAVTAPHDGVIAELHVALSDMVDAGELLVTVEEVAG